MSTASTPAGNVPPPQKLTLTIWLVLIMAAIGFAFDIYELLMLPLVLRGALLDLVGARPGTPEFQQWLGILFYVPAIAGGLFGLLGGWLTDRFGRRRVLTWSILLYAFSAFAAGFSTNIYMLLVLRCTTFIGVCVEFVAAVAWLAELFPNPEQREKALGYTQAFSSIGGLMVAVVNGILLSMQSAGTLTSISLPVWMSNILGTVPVGEGGLAWRYTLMSGLIPAIPLILIRPFLPESPVWAQKRQAGTLKRPSLAALFAPDLRRTTLITALMVAMNYGAAFGAIQMMPQIVPGLADVKAKATELAEKASAGARAKAEKDGETDAKKLDTIADRAGKAARGGFEQKMASEYTKVQEIGGLIGRFLLAILIVLIVSRRAVLWIFQIPGLILMPLIFYYFLQVENKLYFEINLESIYLGKLPITTASLGIFLCGLLTVAQFSFWGNYLPVVYPLHLRGTGESFAANIGGRLVGTSFAAITSYLVTLAPSDLSAPMRYAYCAAGVALFVYLVGFIASFWLPEPKPETLEE